MRGILVGLGNRAEIWLKTCRDQGKVQMVAYVEPSVSQKDRAVKSWGVPSEKIYSSLDEAIGTLESKADFVLDVTPPASHAKIALTAFKAGLHVLGEKPLSDDFDAAKKVVRAGIQSDVRHMITQNYRFDALPRTSRRLLREGILGDPAQLDIAFYMAWADIPGSHYVTEPFMFLTDMGIHHFDMARYVLRREAETVQALTWNLPWGWHKGDASHVVVFKMVGGMRAIHRAVGCTLGRKTSWNGDWRIEGPKGCLTWEDNRLFFTLDHRTDKPHREELTLDAQPYDGQRMILEEFLTSIREGRDPECCASDNLKSMSMVFAAVKSAKERREVRLDEI
jgi:predicted dehydrogenase